LIGDPLRLGQILINLVHNAIKFSDKGEIVVRVMRKSDARPISGSCTEHVIGLVRASASCAITRRRSPPCAELDGVVDEVDEDLVPVSRDRDQGARHSWGTCKHRGALSSAFCPQYDDMR